MVKMHRMCPTREKGLMSVVRRAVCLPGIVLMTDYSSYASIGSSIQKELCVAHVQSVLCSKALYTLYP